MVRKSGSVINVDILKKNENEKKQFGWKNMNKKELKFILEGKEGFKIEFKENLSGIDKDIVAFANAKGGRIFVGISDDNKIKGVKITNKLKSEIQNMARNCNPSVEINLEEFGNVLIVCVKEGIDKPYKCSSGFYLRQSSNSQKLMRDEILYFAVSEGKLKFDEQINTKFNFEKDFDEKKLNDYLIKAKISKILSNEEILVNLGVARREDKRLLFNNAGVLFFAKQPLGIIQQAYITCIRYKGIENVDIIDRLDLKEGIISNIDNAINFVRRNTRLSYEIKDIQRKEIPEYPIEAIREAITNAVMHRNYFEKGANVFVNIFDNRLEIYNPGGLPKGLSIKDFGKKCIRRNPLIADLLHRIGYVEKAGTGINRMNKSMSENGLPEPKIEITSFFTITFKSGGVVSGGVGGVVSGGVKNRINNLLDHLKRNQKITTKEYMRLVNIPLRTAQRDLSSLQKQKIIKFVGPPKTGYYCFDDTVNDKKRTKMRKNNLIWKSEKMVRK